MATETIDGILSSIAEIAKTAEDDLRAAESESDLYDRKVKYLGKKGSLKAIMRNVGQLSAEDRPKVGQEANVISRRLEALYQELVDEMKRKVTAASLAHDQADITLPGTGLPNGSAHPLTLITREVEAFFTRLGFDIAIGPEIETDYYNFEALNIPPDHPAREMQDTFYMEDGRVLRTQTSDVQIHYMESHKPPLRIISPGRVYRCDADQTHSPMFHQIEGLLVDKRVTFTDLKGTLAELVKHLFPQAKQTRFRPSFFPFTEPSAEVDMEFETPKGTRWLEIGGCGMVDPAVFEKVGYDPEEWTGWAFGLGVERIAMLKYGITDIRTFYENDVRFLSQFAG